jgi:regulator of protease activity HflC (stomatin/prohibitin superfamily)
MLSRLLSYILMNPRTILAALTASVVLNLGLAGAVFVKDTEADGQRTRAVAAEATVAAQTSAAQAIAEAGKLRAETAERAMRSAQEAGRADRAAAQRYLNLPLPAAADRCDAARALVDEAVVDARS